VLVRRLSGPSWKAERPSDVGGVEVAFARVDGAVFIVCLARLSGIDYAPGRQNLKLQQARSSHSTSDCTSAGCCRVDRRPNEGMIDSRDRRHVD